MKYSYTINVKPEEVEKLMRSNVSELSLRIRLAETLVPAKVQTGIYGKVQNGAFDIVDFRTYLSPNRTMIPNSMAFFHMKGKIVDTNNGSQINLRFAFSAWYFIVRFAVALILWLICELICVMSWIEITTIGLKTVAIIFALFFALPVMFDVLFGMAVNKKNKQEMLDFIVKLFDLNIKTNETDLD